MELTWRFYIRQLTRAPNGAHPKALIERGKKGTSGLSLPNASAGNNVALQHFVFVCNSISRHTHLTQFGNDEGVLALLKSSYLCDD